MESIAPFFSIIMPIYNADAYIEKAINSILEQSFADFELILVDDCSIDNSLIICRQYAEKDKRIKVLKNAINSGASVARNKGLANAVGKYCGFVDADDYIDQRLLENVYEALLISNADMLKFGVFEEYYSDKGQLVSRQKFSPGNFIINNEIDIKAKAVELEMIPLFGYMWNSFYKNFNSNAVKEVVRLNPNISINEDFDYNIRFLSNVKCMQGIDCCAYHYAKRVNNSMSTRGNERYYEDHMRKINSFINLYGSVNNMPDGVRSNVFWLYTRYVFSAMERVVEDYKRNNIWNIIKSDLLFVLFKKTSFVGLPAKSKIMTMALKSGNGFLIKIIVKAIGLTKKNAPILFSIIKR